MGATTGFGFATTLTSQAGQSKSIHSIGNGVWIIHRGRGLLIVGTHKRNTRIKHKKNEQVKATKVVVVM